MTKATLRKKYKKLRHELPKEIREDLSLEIVNQLLKLKIWDYDFYHVFLPIESLAEINTEYLLSILNGKDKNCVISKSDFETRSMHHYLLTDNVRILLNNYGIPEPQNGIQIQPEQLDVVFVPLLAFDKKGNRLGYGKGFYDRFLSECKPEALKIGLSFFDAEELIHSESTDIPLTHCITPHKTYKF